MQKAEALYIHVPFCIRKCSYCDFCSEPIANHDIHRFVRALCLELEQRRVEYGAVKSLFLGGGTPSLLPESDIAALMQCLNACCSISSDAEITIEANPATVDESRLRALHRAGFNRISIGIQSVHNDELLLLGRLHDCSQAAEAVHAARKAGFENVSVDAIYGIPGQDMARWRETLWRLLELKPDHISAYELTPEPGTPLYRNLESRLYALPHEETTAEMFLHADAVLSGSGYEHYEISNYALRGRRCIHNMAYWQRRPYAGLGPSAHSFNGIRRSANHEDIEQYVSLLETGQSAVAEASVLSEDDAWIETVFLGLRTIDGVCRSSLPEEMFSAIEKALQNESLQGLAVLDHNRLRLTLRGWLLSNDVIATILSGIEKRLHA